MQSICIHHVRAVDMLRDETCDILIEKGRISQVANALHIDADLSIDGTGLTAMPGLFDMHVHFRDPGQTQKEDLQTGTAAALAGGVTGVLCMPNTTPPMDDSVAIASFLQRAEQTGVQVCQAGCLTVGMRGTALADYAAMRDVGVSVLSDDGRPVANEALMEAALRKAKSMRLLVASHCEDLQIIDGGIMNLGTVSRELGVKGMDRRSEDSITMRELRLAEKTHAHVHICHVSTKDSVEAIRQAKAAGVPVTCETAPHYFLLTDELLRTRDANYRMNPPLRTEADRVAIVEGVLDGTIDCIVTDHAPHTAAEKADFLTAPNGIVGLETSLAATLTAFYQANKLPLQDIVRLMSGKPRQLLRKKALSLTRGSMADLVLVDLSAAWTIVPEQLHSKSHNTAFQGMTLTGKPLMTISGGVIRYCDPRLPMPTSKHSKI